MGRKSKKIETIKENTNTSQVLVDGNVSLTIKRNNRTLKTYNLHNKPTINLFLGIVQALSSFEYANIENYLPRFLFAGTSNAADIVSITSLYQPITMPAANVERINSPRLVDDKGVVKFQAIIPYSSIGSTAIIRELGLYGTSNSNSDSMVARVLTPDIQLTKGESLYVQWTFSVESAN